MLLGPCSTKQSVTLHTVLSKFPVVYLMLYKTTGYDHKPDGHVPCCKYSRNSPLSCNSTLVGNAVLAFSYKPSRIIYQHPSLSEATLVGPTAPVERAISIMPLQSLLVFPLQRSGLACSSTAHAEPLLVPNSALTHPFPRIATYVHSNCARPTRAF